MVTEEETMGIRYALTAICAAALLAAVVGCAGMSARSYEDYKAMVAGRADAQLVGNKTCWGCHMNETHASQSDAAVSCEDCHGAGDLAVKDLHEEKGRMACDYRTFINIGELPKPAQTMVCIKCHSGNATFNLHNWNASAHSLNGVSCIDCHNVHHGADLKPGRADMDKLCYGCHQTVRAQFMLPTHHAVPEGKVSCVDCHDPHGSPNPGPMLVRQTVKETCARCHAEKEGPYVFEHADVMEDCTICHFPHGSANDNLLAERMPYLCLQCHAHHNMTTQDTARRFGANCTDCHSQVHGTDLNGRNSGRGRFLR